jgi:malate dehydrogenase
VDRAKAGGGEIVKLMGTSAYYAPASGTIMMVESIVRDKKRILPCAGYCDSEYGVGGYFVGVPCVLGASGVEKIIEVDLDDSETKLMNESISHVKDLVKIVQETFPELK